MRCESISENLAKTASIPARFFERIAMYPTRRSPGDMFSQRAASWLPLRADHSAASQTYSHRAKSTL
jgi:hypothetical protein